MPAFEVTAWSSMLDRSSRQRKLGSSWNPTHMRSAAMAVTGAMSDSSAQTKTSRIKRMSGNTP